MYFLKASTKRMYPKLPTGQQTLMVHSYARIVDRIFNNPIHSQQQTAKRLLGWITFSKRPLKWHEIQSASSIDIEYRVVNFEGRQTPDHIRDICGSLVEILPGNRVQLVHATARQ